MTKAIEIINSDKENAVKKVELRALATEQVQAYNNAVQTGKYDVAMKCDESIKETISEYTGIAQKECFKGCLSTDDPMLEAVKRLTFDTIGVKDKKVGDDKTPVREVVDKAKPIDLLKLHKAAKDGIGHDKKWNYIAEKFNFLLTAKRAVDLGIDPTKISDSYAMNSISREIDMGKTPMSKTNILKTLQTVITAMIGEEYKATSHDVNYLLAIYSKKGKQALHVQCANHRYLRNYLAEICHRIVLGKCYGIEYKAKRLD